MVAAIRHVDTDYDDLLMAGIDRGEARARVQADVDLLLQRWRTGLRGSDGAGDLDSLRSSRTEGS